MIHSFLGALLEKFRQLCQVEENISERSIWKAISCLKRATEAGPQSSAESSKCCLGNLETNIARDDIHKAGTCIGLLVLTPALSFGVWVHTCLNNAIPSPHRAAW